MNCLAKNVIYVIICKGCKKQYIGQTCDLRKRVNVHRHHIKDSSAAKLPMSAHIASCSPNMDFSIFPFYKMNNDDKQERLIKEEYFIKKYKPELNALNF